MVLNGKHYSPWICIFMYFPIEYHGFGIPSSPSWETPRPRSPRCWCRCSERPLRFPRCSVSHRCCKVHHDLAANHGKGCNRDLWQPVLGWFGCQLWEILKSPTAQTSWVGLPKIPANLLGSCPRRKASEPNSRLLWPAQGIEWCWSQAGHSSSACAAIAEQYRCMCDQVYHGQNLVYGCIWGMVLGTPTHNVYSIQYTL